MGEYPRIASFGIDMTKFCAMIDKFQKPKENEMTPKENIYRSDRDSIDQDWQDIVDTHHGDIDGIVDIEGYGEDAYNDGWDDDDYYDDSMDGDFDSAMRDAGFGTDEDYGYYGEDY